MYEQTWAALKAVGKVRLKISDPVAKTRIVRGVSKEKNADPSKPPFDKIFVDHFTIEGQLYLELRLETITKTRYNIPL
jgi:hypothetical protein